jgi:hypothetical protein
LKQQNYASSKRSPAKNKATPKKQGQRNDEEHDEACLDSNATSIPLPFSDLKKSADFRHEFSFFRFLMIIT